MVHDRLLLTFAIVRDRALLLRVDPLLIGYIQEFDGTEPLGFMLKQRPNIFGLSI